MLSDTDYTIPIPPLPVARGPYFPRTWAQACQHVGAGDVLLLRTGATAWTARVVRDEATYRALASGLTMPECYVVSEAAL